MELAVANFRLASFTLEPMLEIFRLRTSFGIVRLGTNTWGISLEYVRLGSFALDFSFGIVRLATFVWEFSLGSFHWGSAAWNPSFEGNWTSWGWGKH